MPGHFSRLLLIALIAFAGCDKWQQLTAGDIPKDQQAKTEMATAKAALGRGDLDQAAAHYERAASLSPNDPWPALQLGDIYSRLGNEPQAILSYKRAIELAPDDVEARKRLADLYTHEGRADLAAQILKDAQRLAPEKDTASRRKLARSLLATGKVDDAEAEVQRIVSDDPSDGESVALQAEILSLRGDDDRATKLFDAALTLSPESAGVRLARERYFVTKGKMDAALAELDGALKTAADDPDVATERAKLLCKMKRYEEARETMEAVAKRRPTDLAAQAGLAEIQMLSGDLPAARVSAENVLARQPHSGRALYVRARAIEEEGDLERASAAYRAVLDADPTQADTLSRLAAVSLKLGRNGDAMTALERLYFSREATLDEEVQLASLYAETGIDKQRAAHIADECLKRSSGDEQCLKIKKQVESSKTAKSGPGVQIIKGRSH
jgi:tetratricopeptide (TPR) repeat protein